MTTTRPKALQVSWTDHLEAQCDLLQLPKPEREFRFWPGRRFRFDLAWPVNLVAVEVEGVTYSRVSPHLFGRHVTASGFRNDIEKYAEAACRGWVVLRVLPDHVKTGVAVGWIGRVLATRGGIA